MQATTKAPASEDCTVLAESMAECVPPNKKVGVLLSMFIQTAPPQIKTLHCHKGVQLVLLNVLTRTQQCRNISGPVRKLSG